MNSDTSSPRGGYQGSDDEDASSDIKQPKELTKFEKDQIELSKKRHKDTIVKPQVIMGKEFKGTSFIAKPEKIIFKDFEVGKMHQQTIQMTNVSYSFNQFKLLEMKDSVKDFFNIIYQPSGRIGAGISTPVLIQFIPQVNEDIFDYLPLLSETGPVNVPIECTCKKAIVQVESNVIDFKKVIYGESLKQEIVFRNIGALPTDIIFKNKKGVALGRLYDVASTRTGSILRGKSGELDALPTEGPDADESKLMAQLKFVKQTKINGYDTTIVTVDYIPSEVGRFEYDMIAYFENYLYSPPITITLKGECVEVPIYVEKPIYDLETCLPGHIYREKIVFYNRGHTAMKIQMEPPKETKRFFEFNPSLGYIQAGSKFEIWVKFIAEVEVLQMCAKYKVEDTVLEIPFKLVGADQVLPVDFHIRLRLTTDKVNFIPPLLDFGRIYEKTAASRKLKVQNLSDLPQEVLFFPLPKNIRLHPDIIPLRLLPKSTIEIKVTYLASEAMLDESEMRVKIITGNIATRDTKLNYKADIQKCPITFSNYKIDMPAIQEAEKYHTNVLVKNNSKTNTLAIEFFLPYFEICGIKMTPMTTVIPPEKSIDVIVEFFSFFKKLKAFTLHDLKEKYEKDPNYNFEYRQKIKAEEEKKKEEERLAAEEAAKKGGPGAKKAVPEKKAPEPAAAKKPVKLTKQQEKEAEEEAKKQKELEKLKEEEERRKLEEIEKNFDGAAELEKLGGVLTEFHDPEDSKHSQHYEWIVPCYFSIKNENSYSESSVAFIQITTVTVKKNLIVDYSEINFGEVAVGLQESRQLMITNQGQEEVKLEMDLLPIFGGFSVIGALREIDVGKKKGIWVRFEPRQQQYFEETLRLFSSTSQVSVKLKGSGVRPVVKLTPATGLLNAGSVLLGEYATHTFSVENMSNFSVKFKLVSKARGIQNKNGSEVFSFIPSEGTIEAHSTLTIKVIFRPDRVSENFYEIVTIDVPNQDKEKSLFVAGMCFPRQAWINCYKPFVFPEIPDMQSKIPEYPLDFLAVKDDNTVYGCGNNKILLEFKKITSKDDKDEYCFQRKIAIGASKLMDSKTEKPTNFEIIMPKDSNHFTCDVLKGTVPAGGSQVVTFTFKPPEADLFIAGIEALEGIGQWIDPKAEVKIGGGLARQGYSEQFSIEISLRAYINQL